MAVACSFRPEHMAHRSIQFDGLEERSRVFDHFRTRAVHSLVEVHFSRFRSLTDAQSGATLCVFVGAARTASAIGYRRGAAVDGRLEGLYQQLPGTSRKTTGVAHVDHLVGPRSRLLTEHVTRRPRRSVHRMVGDREDSTANRTVQ